MIAATEWACLLQSWRPRHRALGVEAALQARDQVGVQDFVLLERFESEDAFVDNLRKRFAGDLIYVSFFATYVALVSSRDRERQRGGNSTKHVINSYSMNIPANASASNTEWCGQAVWEI